MISDPTFHIGPALYRGRYMETVAFMEHNGIPIDINTLDFLKRNWTQIQERLILENNKIYGVYEGTTFKINKFEHCLNNNGIAGPRTEEGNLELKDDTFKDMVKKYPQLQELRDLR